GKLWLPPPLNHWLGSEVVSGRWRENTRFRTSEDTPPMRVASMDCHNVRPKRSSPPSHSAPPTSPTSSTAISAFWLERAHRPELSKLKRESIPSGPPPARAGGVPSTASSSATAADNTVRQRMGTGSLLVRGGRAWFLGFA